MKPDRSCSRIGSTPTRSPPGIPPLFDEALNHNDLIKPDGESAWDHYNTIKANVLRTPPELIKKMRQELLAKPPRVRRP